VGDVNNPDGVKWGEVHKTGPARERWRRQRKKLMRRRGRADTDERTDPLAPVPRARADPL
jgi:hypothetical protein